MFILSCNYQVASYVSRVSSGNHSLITYCHSLHLYNSVALLELTFPLDFTHHLESAGDQKQCKEEYLPILYQNLNIYGFPVSYNSNETTELSVWTTTCTHAILISIIVQLILWILSSIQCQSLNVGRFLMRLYGFQFLHQGEIYLWQETVLNGHIASCNFPCHMPTFLTFTMWWSHVSKATPRINYIAILCIHLSSIMMVFSHTKSALATTTVVNETRLLKSLTDHE